MTIKFVGHFAGETAPRGIPESYMRGLFGILSRQWRKNNEHPLTWEQFCERICEAQISVATAEGDFWGIEA